MAVLWNLQGFPEFADDEIVSVPDAKYTKGEFEVRAFKNIHYFPSYWFLTVGSIQHTFNGHQNQSEVKTTHVKEVDL